MPTPALSKILVDTLINVILSTRLEVPEKRFIVGAELCWEFAPRDENRPDTALFVLCCDGEENMLDWPCCCCGEFSIFFNEEKRPPPPPVLLPAELFENLVRVNSNKR